MANKLAAKDAEAAERRAEMERHLAKREEEHAAALGAREAVAANERTAVSQEAEQQRNEATVAERKEAQEKAEAARKIDPNALSRHIPRGTSLRGTSREVHLNAVHP